MLEGIIIYRSIITGSNYHFPCQHWKRTWATNNTKRVTLKMLHIKTVLPSCFHVEIQLGPVVKAVSAQEGCTGSLPSVGWGKW